MGPLALTALVLAGASASSPSVGALSGAWFYPAADVDRHLAHRGDFALRYSDANPLTLHFDRPGHVVVAQGQDDCETELHVVERRGATEVLSVATCAESSPGRWSWTWKSPTEVEVVMNGSTVRLKRLDKTRSQLEAEDHEDLTRRTFTELAGTYLDGDGARVTLTPTGEVKRSAAATQASVCWCALGEEDRSIGVCVVLSASDSGPALRVQKDGTVVHGDVKAAEELDPARFTPDGVVWRRSK